MDSIADTLDRVVPELLRRGNLPKAEILLQTCQRAEPNNPKALYFLGQIAAAVNLPQFALRYFGEAATLAPHWELPRINLGRVRQPITPTAAEKFLLIKAWGYGFWADVAHVLSQALLAEMTGRIPVVQWGTNSLFGDGTPANAFAFYFEPLSDHSIADLQDEEFDLWPPKWTYQNLLEDDINKWSGPYSGMAALYFLGRPETVVVADFFTPILDLIPWIPRDHPLYGLSNDDLWRYLVHAHLRPRRDIIDTVDRFIEQNLGNHAFVAAHLRGSDKAFELTVLPELNRQSCSLIDDYLVRLGCKKLFVMTDDENILRFLVEMYGDKVVATACQRTSDDRGVHYHDVPDRRRLGIEVMVDAYIAARANAFVGNGLSNPSIIVRYLKDWPVENVTLIGENMYHVPNTYRHDW